LAELVPGVLEFDLRVCLGVDGAEEEPLNLGDLVRGVFCEPVRSAEEGE